MTSYLQIEGGVATVMVNHVPHMSFRMKDLHAVRSYIWPKDTESPFWIEIYLKKKWFWEKQTVIESGYEYEEQWIGVINVLNLLLK